MNLNKIVNLLIKDNLHIATAESCTGGMVCSKLVNVGGVSNVLDLSVVTYANEAKIKLLGVNSDTIAKYGVVSEEVAKEMVIGISRLANSEVAISTSGIAGPSGSTKNKPIGMVCFGLKIRDDIYTYTKYFGEIGRNKVRLAATNFILNELLIKLEN